jgi:hypothetical protein
VNCHAGIRIELTGSLLDMSRLMISYNECMNHDDVCQDKPKARTWNGIDRLVRWS